jgi:PAS domain S-box-containing protein
MSQEKLRNEAESIINRLQNKQKPVHSDTDKTLHELQVYQIELELQNDELKRASDELLKSHKRFTDLFELAPVGYFLLNEDFKILNVNLSASLMFGLEKESLMGKSFTLYVDPSWQDTFYLLMKRAMRSDILSTDEVKLKKKGKETFFAELQCIRDFDAITGARRVRMVMMDISERKIIETKLKRFRAALDSTADNIFLIDYHSFRFIDVNDSAIRNLGFSREEFLKMKPRDINPAYSSKSIDRIKNEFLHDVGNHHTLEMQHRKKEGEIIDVEVYLKTVLIDDEKIIVAVARDITERKKNQNKLASYARELEELNAGKDKFLSIISHDLRGPFLGLKGYTQMLIEEYDLLEKEEILDYLDKILNSTKDLYTLVDNLLKWSRLELGKIPYEPMAFNLFDEMESLIKLLTGIAIKKDITLENNIPKNLYPYADRIMLISVLQNLIGNAIKFTRKNGNVRVNASEQGDDVVISVEDDGVGMTREAKDKLFTLDKGHTTRGTAGEKGTGFGLIIAKEMVKKMGGEISVKSELAKGSVFTFTLKKSNYKPRP